jgi:hypothetical protein
LPLLEKEYKRFAPTNPFNNAPMRDLSALAIWSFVQSESVAPGVAVTSDNNNPSILASDNGDADLPLSLVCAIHIQYPEHCA